MSSTVTSLSEKQRWMRERKAPVRSTEKGAMSTANFAQRHYTIAEIGEMWNLSQDAVRRIFESEPGVLILGSLGSKGRRRYTTLRIPRNVAERVYRRQLRR